ncbi:MAG: SMC family ATPase [Anaerolineales bacterium]|nr:SMC family ATPase [Anaerolineales bacterium]
MIPKTLELTNFLSYRETAVLDFNGIHLACISGTNGAGKSSILDGITWVLFGNSRTKSDDDLVNRIAAREGSTAEVRFIFDLEGSTYRITRRRRHKKSSMLELQIAADFDGDNQPTAWKTLSESKIRETQAAVETLLRMNYDTFINASFLLQGKADEFTTKSPNRRKEILADLLGVSEWETYRAVTSERRKTEEGKLSLLDAQTTEIESELDEASEREAKLAAAKAASAQVAERLKDKEALLKQLQRAETVIKQQEHLVTNLGNNLVRAQRTLANLEQTRTKRQEEIEQHRAILDEASAIHAAYAQWQQIDSELQAWQAKANEFNRLSQAKRPFELEIERERSRLEQQVKTLTGESERVQTARTERDVVADKLATTATTIQALTAQLTELAAQEAAYHEARSKWQQLEGEQKLLAQEANQLQTQAKRIQKLEAEKTAVFQNAAEAEKMVADLTTQITHLHTQNNQLMIARADLDTLKRNQPQLRAEMDKLKARIDQLAADGEGSCPLCGQPLSAEHRADVLVELQADGKSSGDRYRQNQQQIGTLEKTAAELDKALKEQPFLEKQEKTQQERLIRAQARLTEIEETLREWQANGQVRLADLTRQLADDKALTAQKQKVAALETAVQQKAALEKEKQAAQREQAQTEARLAEIDRLLTEWETSGRDRLNAARQQLDTHDFAADAQAELDQLNDQQTAIGYDADAHTATKQQRDALKDAPTRHQTLQQAEAAIKPLETAVVDLNTQIAEQTQSLAELRTQHDTAQSDLAQMKADGGDLEAAEDEVAQLRQEQIAANRQVGAAQQRLDVLDDLRSRKTQLADDRARLTQLIQRLKLLEKACGRNGVQALLIEYALPEIEDRANELLERLTGGDMRVHSDTQRQLKSRDELAETLDIRIVDGAGERPYDNYSGGEQFRINFAIRLALSQVLAKRAGARLQTLVIDEGFGSQDPNGRQRLVEAINTIQNEFARILVITHIDELRDAFPNRIDVEKTAVGSTIAVV